LLLDRFSKLNGSMFYLVVYPKTGVTNLFETESYFSVQIHAKDY